jgi:hypothetical protein
MRVRRNPPTAASYVGGDYTGGNRAGRDIIGGHYAGRDMNIRTNDPARLGPELEVLRAYLQPRATRPELMAAVDQVRLAQVAASDGDREGVDRHLTTLARSRVSGGWALAAATTIGTSVAAAALRTALGV